jgi:peptidylprolyl isomerase
MFRKRLLIMPVLLLALAACGVATDNTASAPNSSGAGTTPQSPAASSSTAASSSATASTGATASGQATNGDDPAARNNKYSAAPEMTIDPNKTYTATIETTKGTMKAELYAKEAPMAVNNFVFLARDNFYQGIKFHRIIKDFMVQTGDPTGTGRGGPGYRFADEPVTREYERGTLAMANAGPNTNGSQFFIVHQDSQQLPKDYTIFGKLTEGLDVLDALANTPTTGAEGSTPTEDVRITNITIEEK